MYLIGLTGGIASGKSTVSFQFIRLGCPVIDADKIAREGKQILLSPAIDLWSLLADADSRP